MHKSYLTTDGYKFSMGQAGFPLRNETFYLSFRKGGWQYVPFDLEAMVREMLPELAEAAELRFLRDHGLEMTSSMRFALDQRVTVRAVPAGTWVYEREPILTVTGPSFVVSWLEPQVLRLFYPIQLATHLARLGRTIPEDLLICTCDEQAEIVRHIAATMKLSGIVPKVQTDKYRKWVSDQAVKVLAAVGQDAPYRVFEVGMRAATCEGQHRIALEELRGLGIKKTSNVALAQDLDMVPVGTMGHEHVQRWGSDLAAYRAMRDMRMGAPSYLLDTFDTVRSGIPAAIKVMQEQHHEQGCAVRYDSGDKYGQYIYAHGEFQRHGLKPTHILEDGLDAEMTAKFERLRDHTGLSADNQVYGYGGYLVDRGWSKVGREDVAAVYKLTQTGGEPCMKFGNELGLGKVSVPGHPIAWRRLRGTGPQSIIGQLGEAVPEDYVELNGNPEAMKTLYLCNANTPSPAALPYALSPETRHLVGQIAKDL